MRAEELESHNLKKPKSVYFLVLIKAQQGYTKTGEHKQRHDHDTDTPGVKYYSYSPPAYFIIIVIVS